MEILEISKHCQVCITTFDLLAVKVLKVKFNINEVGLEDIVDNLLGFWGYLVKL